jgi:hypothetical protein
MMHTLEFGMPRMVRCKVPAGTGPCKSKSTKYCSRGGHLNPVTPVRVPLPKIFVVFGTTIFARSSNADTCIFTCVPVATRWL